MTISAVVLEAGPFSGNGVTTAFPFTFKCFSKSEMIWTKTDVAAVEHVLVLDLDYSVALNVDQNTTPGGTITFPLGGSAYAILAAGEKLVGVSNAPETQLVDLVAAGGWFPEVVENALDRAVMLIQQLSQLLNRAIVIPASVSGVSTQTPAPAPNTIFGWNAAGTALVNYVIQAGTSLVDLAASTGSSLIGFIQPYVGSVLRTIQSKLRDSVSPEDFGAIGDNTNHPLSERFATLAAAQAVYPFVTALTQQIDWAAWQAAVNACSHQFDSLPKPAIQMGAGKKYKIGADPIVPPGYIIKVYGQGMQNSFINFTGAACFKSPALQYFCPLLHDFTIEGDAASGIGIDMSPTTIQAFLFDLDRLAITSGGDCIYGPRTFSGKFGLINGNSFNGHTFRVACGPAVSWQGTYAATCGAGKTGYRLTGTIRMKSCNGLNAGDYWGVFGSNPTGTNGTAAWQNDFAGITSYPDVVLDGCNVEAFTINGVWCVQSPQRLEFDGGTIDRSAFATAYHSLVRVSVNPLGANSPGCVFKQTRFFPGAGAPTGAFLYSDAAAQFVELFGDELTGAGITTYRAAGVALNYPIIRGLSVTGDVFQGNALQFSALSARRISAEMLRFKELVLADGTTVADATGYTAIKTANTAATNLTTVNFTTTVGADLDAERNGFLMITVNDNFTTLIESQGGANGLWLRDKCKYKAARGDMFLFMFSPLFNGSSSGWVEIGRSTRYSPEVTDINKLFEDFIGRTINANIWQGRVGSDGACVAPAILANQNRGVARLTTGAGAGASMAVNGSQLDSALNWIGNNQNVIPGLVAEFRVAMSAITNVAVFVGFTNQVAALQMPFTLGVGDALTVNAADAVGVLFDTNADTDNWWLVGAKASVAAAKQNTAVAPVASTFETWRIEISGNGGAVTFSRNGVVIGVAMANGVTLSAPLTPVVACFSSAAASRNIDVDYVLVQQPRV